MKVLDLFSGVGGMSLGLERAGMQTVGFCEIDPWCRRVLAKHWPDVWQHDDVRTLCRRVWMNNPSEDYENDGWLECSIHTGQDFGECPCIGTDQFLDEVGPVDLVCGGFPCQDISNAGRRAGIGGDRSGLWSEMCRIIGELRPQYALMENVAALIGRGLDAVLGDMAEIGYDAEWHCIPAAAVGAPHLRDRIWILAYPTLDGWNKERADAIGIDAQEGAGRVGELVGSTAERTAVPDSKSKQKRTARSKDAARKQSRRVAGGGVECVPHPQLPRLERAGLRRAIADSPVWLPEPGVGRVVNGVPDYVDRLAALGNSVVPQIVECIGRAIINAAPAAGAGE